MRKILTLSFCALLLTTGSAYAGGYNLFVRETIIDNWEHKGLFPDKASCEKEAKKYILYSTRCDPA